MLRGGKGKEVAELAWEKGVGFGIGQELKLPGQNQR